MVRAGLAGISHLANKAGLPTTGAFSWLSQPIRPADIVEGLCDAMFDRNNMVEDVNYQKVVPNRYIVEVSRTNFSRRYQPIREQIIQQLTNQLLENLMTTNRRRGRKEFRFGGRIQLDINPAADLKDDEAKILCRVEQVEGSSSPSPKQAGMNALFSASLEHTQTGQHWALYPGINTIGRNEICQIYIDHPLVQEKRLVSGQHAYILIERGACSVFDGSPGGRPSANGTYVNLHRVQTGGSMLQDGDEILLAAVDPLHPRVDIPGVVSFLFRLDRKGG